MDDVKICHMDSYGFLNQYNKNKNSLEVQKVILKILNASSYETAMNAFVELYYLCGKNMKNLKKVLSLPLTSNRQIKDIPIIKKIASEFNPQNIMIIEAIVGYDEKASSLRERAIYEPDIFYIACEGKTDKEILSIYEERKHIYWQINRAILLRDISYLKENIELIKTIPCYQWCLSYFALENETKRVFKK